LCRIMVPRGPGEAKKERTDMKTSPMAERHGDRGGPGPDPRHGAPGSWASIWCAPFSGRASGAGARGNPRSGWRSRVGEPTSVPWICGQAGHGCRCRGSRPRARRALSSAWGMPDFHDINVRGTENLLAVALPGRAPPGLYLLPSVISRHQAQVVSTSRRPIRRSSSPSTRKPRPLPRCVSRTPGARARNRDPEAKAIYGPGDQPCSETSGGGFRAGCRSWGRQRGHQHHPRGGRGAGRAPGPGVGAGRGKTYLITAARRSTCWRSRGCSSGMGLPPLRKRVSVDRAMWAGRLLEEIWKKGHLKGSRRSLVTR